MSLIVEVPAHMSHSQASNFSGEGCPTQYFFERVIGVPSIPGWAQLGGSALHAASEDWDNQYLAGEVIQDPSALQGMFEMSFDIEIRKVEEHTPYPQGEWHRSGRQSRESSPHGGPNKKDEAWWRRWGPTMLASYVSWRLASPWEIAWLCPEDTEITPTWGIEVPFEVEMGGVRVLGYIDRVFHQVVDGVDTYLVIDLKSGKEPETSAQLGTYRVGLIRRYGVDPVYGAYWLGGSGGSTSLVDLRKAWPEARVDKRFATARRRQLAGEFDCAGCWFCLSGGVRDYVANAGGSKAHTVPQPWEVEEVRIAAPRT
jgi:hypothetical protein